MSTSCNNSKILMLLCVIMIIMLLHINGFKNKFSNDTLVLEADPQNWQKILSETDVVFCKFYAPWCPHCTKLDEPLNQLANEYANDSQVKIIKLNADKYQALGQQEQVQGFPTIRIYKKGNPVANYQGQRTVEGFKQYIEQNVTRT